MLRRFLRDAGIYGISRIAVRSLSLFLVPLFTRILTPEEYGTLDLLTVFGALAGVTVALEVAQGVARYFADARDAEAKVAYASTSLWFTVLAYAAFLAPVVVFAPAAARMLLGSAEHVGLVRVAAVAIALNHIFYLLQNQLRWELKPGHYTVASLVYTLLSLTLAVVLVVGMRIGVVGYFWGQIAAGVVGSALSLYFSRQSFAFTFDWHRLREMLSFSLPLVPSSVAVFATVYIDRLALGKLLSLDAVGIYGIAYRLASIGTLVMVGVQAALTPLVYTHHRDEGAALEIARIFRLFVTAALLLWAVLGIFAREVLIIFTTPAYYPAADLVPVLVPTLFLLKMYVFAPGLDLAKRTGVTATINIVAGAANTVLNFLLIPRIGIWGAAVGTSCSAVLMFGAYMYFSQQCYRVPHDWRRLAIGTSVTAVVVAVGAGLGAPIWIRIPVKVLLVLLAAATFMAAGLIDARMLRRGWRRVTARTVPSRV